jgi:hypothetical protein
MGVGGDEVEAADLFRFGDGRDLRRHCKWIYGSVSRRKIDTCSWSRRLSGWTDATEGGRTIEDVIVIEMECDRLFLLQPSAPFASRLRLKPTCFPSIYSKLRAALSTLLYSVSSLPDTPKDTSNSTIARSLLHIPNHSPPSLVLMSHQSASQAPSKPIHNN